MVLKIIDKGGKCLVLHKFKYRKCRVHNSGIVRNNLKIN